MKKVENLYLLLTTIVVAIGTLTGNKFCSNLVVFGAIILFITSPAIFKLTLEGFKGKDLNKLFSKSIIFDNVIFAINIILCAAAGWYFCAFSFLLFIIFANHQLKKLKSEYMATQKVNRT